MNIAYTILELDRHENSNDLRSKLSFLPELKTEVCDARVQYPKCVEKYSQYVHIFKSITNVGLIGLWISTLNAFYDFLNSDFDNLLILEDDVNVINDFENIFKKCILELPKDFGIFSLGYAEVYKQYYNEKFDIKNKKYICKMFQTGSSIGLLYKKQFVEELLNSILKYKILGGFSDTAILSYGLGNVEPTTKFSPYSVRPNVIDYSNETLEKNKIIGGLLTYDISIPSTLENSPNTRDFK